jgi:hypothetical protein
MKLVNDTLNKIRRCVGVTAKGSKYLLLKNHQNLTETDQQKLEQILRQSACLRLAYELKEEFRDIYETSKTVQSGRKRMQNCWFRLRYFTEKRFKLFENTYREYATTLLVARLVELWKELTIKSS